MNGRFSGTAENIKAGEYITGKFKEFGLKQFNNSYLQPFKFYDTLDAGKNTNVDFQVLIRKPGVPENMLKYRSKHWTAAKEYLPMRFSSNGKADGELVFCGYGVTAKEQGYDDYAGIDVKNKIVIVLADSAEGLPLDDFWFPYSDLSYKAENAAEHGAAAIIFVKVLHDSANVYYDFDVDWNYTSTIPAVQANRTEIAFFFPKEQPLLKIEKDINSSKKPNSFVLPDVKISLSIELEKVEKEINNILGFVEGTSANLKDEYVIVGANYDGFGAYWDQPKWRPKVWTVRNSAETNATGTAALIELARNISQNPLQRSVIFVAFNANVSGLSGSAFFANNLPFDKSKTALMLNLSSIGKLRNNKLYAVGTGTGSNFNDLLNNISLEPEIILSKSTKSIKPEDHLSFYNVEIPVMTFTTGGHNDCGKASDTHDKVFTKELAGVTKSIGNIITATGAMEPKPLFNPDPQIRDYKKTTKGYGCKLGIIPSYEVVTQGLAVCDVMKNSPAEKVKIKGGDIILKIDNKEVNSDYELGLLESLVKPGDNVQITLIKDGAEKVISVKMERSK
jgi:hypothetical protein